MPSQSRYPQIFMKDFIKTQDQENQYTFLPKTKNSYTIWIIGLGLSLIICIAVVSGLFWYNKLEKATMNSSKNVEDVEDFYEQHKSFYFNDNNNLDSDDYNVKVEKTKDIDIQSVPADESVITKNVTEILSDVEVVDESGSIKNNKNDAFDLKTIVVDTLGSLSSVALGSKRLNKNRDNFQLSSRQKENKTMKSNEQSSEKSKITPTNHQIPNERKPQKISNLIVEKPSQLQESVNSSLGNVERKEFKTLDSSVLNYLTSIINVNERIQDIDAMRFEDFVAQETTNLVNISGEHAFNEDHYRNKKTNSSKINLENEMVHLVERNNTMNKITHENITLTFQRFLNILKHSLGKFDENYYDQDYFYSENDAQYFYYDYAKMTWANYLLEKIQELHDWIITDLEMEGNGTVSEGNPYAPLPQVLRALNYSLLEGDASILFVQLKRIFYSGNSSDVDFQRNKNSLTNTSSVLSFTLLALDVLLLRNIQLIAWDNQETANREVVSDPDVFAFNALFMDSDKVKSIYKILQNSKDGYSDIDNGKSRHVSLSGVDLTSNFYTNINFGEELSNFIMSTIRAVMNLGYAFRNTRNESKSNMKNSQTETYLKLSKSYESLRNEKGTESNVQKPSEIDCMWILYCKNLEKATKLEGIYGFLAKLNGIGLRLILGKLSAERAIETLVTDTLIGSKNLNCENMFPGCSEHNASKMILEEIMARGSKKFPDSK